MQDIANSLASVIKQEINLISSKPAYTVFYDMDITVHTPKGDVKVLYPVRLDRLKDFVSRFSDVINLSFAMPTGSYEHDVVPYNDNLEVTLNLIPLMSTQDYNRLTSSKIINKRYFARLTEQTSKLVEGNTDLVINKKMLNEQEITIVTVQLVDKVVMALREKTIGTIVRQANPMDIIKYFLTEQSKNLNSGDAEDIKGVNVVDGFTQEVREHVIIPPLTRLTNLPNVVNEQVGGIYSTGFSYYFDSNWWYVYPLYDTTRYAKSDYTLTIINVPKNRLPGSEKTFRLTKNQVIIISTGKVKYEDTARSEKDSLGTVTRFIDSRKVIEGFGEQTDNKFVTDFSSNVNEAGLEPEKNDPTRQELHSGPKVTSAYNKEYSKLAQRQGSKMQVTWENSNDAVLSPGMPVRYMFLVNNKVRQLYGVLLASETLMVPINKNPKLKKMGATTVLSCFMSRDITNSKVE